jgi:hypothetical protein
MAEDATSKQDLRVFVCSLPKVRLNSHLGLTPALGKCIFIVDTWRRVTSW